MKTHGRAQPGTAGEGEPLIARDKFDTADFFSKREALH